jgi:hypothetical protein
MEIAGIPRQSNWRRSSGTLYIEYVGCLFGKLEADSGLEPRAVSLGG